MTDPGIRTHQLVAGRYRIERELGRGGSAVVYRALDERHDRRVAVKVLHPELATALGAQRFLREIKLTASLQHPHIVPIFDSGETEDGLLFFVMPYVEADSLRRELAAVGRVRIDEALRIAREIAGALAYAHERGLIHRDIKPENILFLGGHACLTDFGIARPIRSSGGERLTHHDVIVGTPEYMSPEQGRNYVLDGRSDVYSLACVLYEMLAGVPPFQADTPVNALRQRFSNTPPPIRTQRPDVPPEVEEVLSRALATSPDERYESARAFGEALEQLSTNPGERAGGKRRRGKGRTTAGDARRRRWVVGAGIAAGVLVALGAAMVSPRVRGAVAMGRNALDSSAFAVAPAIADSASAADATAASAAVREALGAWRDVRVVDASGRTPGDTAPASVLAAARAARAAHAIGLRLDAGPAGPVAHATLYDVRSRRPVAEAAVTLGSGAALADSATTLVAALLAQGAPPAATAATEGTRSLAALRAYQRGHEALARFDLTAAAQSFTAALGLDADFAAAHAWLAQTLVWRRAGGWEDHAREAAARRAALRGADTLVADAVEAMRAGEHARACSAYRSMLAADSANAFALLGLGDCSALDSVVVRDARSPSGWVFRGSVHAAMSAYDRATRADARAYGALPESYLRALLRTVAISVRLGHRAGDGALFMGSPVMVHDTIGYYAWPASSPDALNRAEGAIGSLDDALRWDRDVLLGHLTAQLALAPRSIDVLEGLASALEDRGSLMDDSATRGLSALAALDSAAHLATDDVARARIGASRVRVLVKAGEFHRARLAADSLLAGASSASPGAAQSLASVAVITGRAALAIRLLDVANTSEPLGPEAMPQPIRRAARALTVRTALGVCDDSLRQEFRDLGALLDSYVEPKLHARMARAALYRPVTLAAPCLGPKATLLLGETRDRLVLAQQALARGQTAVVRAQFDTLAVIRRPMRPGDVTLDYTVLEAWVQATAGDTAGAERHLDLVLNALPSLGQFTLDVGAAAAVGRAFALRAELAARQHDAPTAARWTLAIAELWAEADPAVQRSVATLGASDRR